MMRTAQRMITVYPHGVEIFDLIEGLEFRGSRNNDNRSLKPPSANHHWHFAIGQGSEPLFTACSRHAVIVSGNLIAVVSAR